MTIAELAALIAGRFDVRQGFYAAHTETGDEYLDFSVVAETEGFACGILYLRFHGYAEAWLDLNPSLQPVLYWRYEPPHIFWHAEDSRLRCRLVLVEDTKPIVFRTIEDYDLWRHSDLERKVTEALMANPNDSHLSQGGPVKEMPQKQHHRMAEGIKITGQDNPYGGEADPKRTITNAKCNY